MKDLPVASPSVVLLHGVMLSGFSMARIAARLRREGFRVINISYPSRTVPIKAIATEFLPRRLERTDAHSAERLHFVAHSMGALVVRQFLESHRPPNLGRVVMLGPPNHGSTAADILARYAFFRWLVGRNLADLRTSPDALPARLRPADFEAGVIAGSTSINFLLSRLVQQPNDGPVSVASSRLEGMRDHLVVRRSHSLMLWHTDVLVQIVSFLRTGRFDRGK